MIYRLRECKFDDLDSDTVEEIEDKLSSRLYFSNIEIYVANMLFDKFLRYGNNCNISIQEMDGYYRKGKKDYRKVRVMKNVYDRYILNLKFKIDGEICISEKFGIVIRNINEMEK